MPRFCKDCCYHTVEYEQIGENIKRPFNVCTHDRARCYDLVTGEEKPRKHCIGMRERANRCGPEGNLWERKP